MLNNMGGIKIINVKITLILISKVAEITKKLSDFSYTIV